MRDETTQEVRLAVVMTGGASLAVWMGGVATEINLATSPGHTRADDADAVVATRYARLAAILDVELSVDVLAGASAGGINATMLGFANARHGGLAPLRELWLSLGSLDKLMRTPNEKAYPSLLRGDAAVLPALHTALRAVAATTTPQQPVAARPTSVFVTTTILRGALAEHTDSLGGTMYDVDYRGLFVFGTPDLTDPASIPHLALSARASSAFPGAFEPAYVPVGHALDDTHPDMARFVNAARSFHASDGGILVNRPIGPALAAIFDRPAERQVRRVLTYVVPSPRPTPSTLDPQPRDRQPRDRQPRDWQPGDWQPPGTHQSRGPGLFRGTRLSRGTRLFHGIRQSQGTRQFRATQRGPEPATDAPTAPPLPSVSSTLLGALGAALNQSIGTDLAALREHNEAVRGVRAGRRRLLRLAPAGSARLADDSVYDAYRREVAEQIAAPVIEALLRVITDRSDLPRPPDTDALRTDAAGRARMTNAAVGAVLATLPDRLPGVGDLDELWRLGQPALDGVRGILVSMINEGYVLCPEPVERARLARLAAAVHDAALAASGGPPHPTGSGPGEECAAGSGIAGARGPASLYTSSPRPGVFTTVSETLAAMPGAALLDVLEEATRRWLRSDLTGAADSAGSSGPPGWASLAPVVGELRGEIAALVRRWTPSTPPPAGSRIQPAGLSVGQRRALAARTLTDFVRYLPTTGASALIALLDLHLVERATTGGVLDQPVELVQISADLPTALDPARRLAEDKVTGLQLGNFGAFAKSSWRANDWMWGRLDGAGWLVRILLDPRRLVLRRDLAVPTGPPADPADPGGVAGEGRVAGTAALARRGWLATLVDDLAEVAGTPVPQDALDELAFLTDPDAPVPPSLPITATWVAAGIQRDIAAKELVSLAQAVRQDNDSGLDPRPTADFLAAVDRALAPEPVNTPPASPPPASTPPASTRPPTSTSPAGSTDGTMAGTPTGAAVISLAAAAAARVAASQRANTEQRANAEQRATTEQEPPPATPASARPSTPPLPSTPPRPAAPPRPPGLSGVPVAPGMLAPRAVDDVLRACQVSAERITDRAQGPILVTGLVQIVAVVAAWIATTRILPRPLRPAAFVLRTAARLAYELVRDVSHGRRRVVIGLGAALVVLGVAGGLVSSGVIGGLGILVALLGLLMIGLTSWRRVPGGLAVLAAGLIAVIAAAGVFPVLHGRLFDWLEDDAVPYLADHPWAWATVFGALVLPGAWSLAEALTTRRTRRRG